MDKWPSNQVMLFEQVLLLVGCQERQIVLLEKGHCSSQTTNLIQQYNSSLRAGSYIFAHKKSFSFVGVMNQSDDSSGDITKRFVISWSLGEGSSSGWPASDPVEEFGTWRSLCGGHSPKSLLSLLSRICENTEMLSLTENNCQRNP